MVVLGVVVELVELELEVAPAAVVGVVVVEVVEAPGCAAARDVYEALHAPFDSPPSHHLHHGLAVCLALFEVYLFQLVLPEPLVPFPFPLFPERRDGTAQNCHWTT